MGMGNMSEDAVISSAEEHISDDCIYKTRSPQDERGAASMCVNSILHGSHTLVVSRVVTEQGALFLFTLL